jgi:hypothetical protein
LGEIVDLGLQSQNIAAGGFGFSLGTVGASRGGERQRLQFFDVVRKLAGVFGHASIATIFTDKSIAFSTDSKHFLSLASALRRLNFHRPDALPVEAFNKRHELRMAQPYLSAARRRPDKVRLLPITTKPPG